LSSWKTIHFFSIVLRKGRVLGGGEGERERERRNRRKGEREKERGGRERDSLIAQSAIHD
jgi:hypothetical protein